MANNNVVTLQDVAKELGVHITTVSSALNGNRSTTRVSESTRERIRAQATAMGYRPNRIARSLRDGKTNTIGLMISDLQNPFFVNVLRCAETMVDEAGYQFLLDVNSSHYYGFYHQLRKVASWLADGVLVWTIPYHHVEEYLGERARESHVVYLGHARYDDKDSVSMDLYGAGKQAVEYLLERGYRKFCFVSDFDTDRLLLPDHQLAGFQNNQAVALRDICHREGLRPEFVTVDRARGVPSESFDVGLQIAARLPACRPDVIICQLDWIAHFVTLGLLKAGLNVPEDIAIMGFDGIEEGKHLPTGPLTTVQMPVDILCRTALEILLRRMNGDTSPAQQILIPTELVVGCTT